MSNTLYIHIGYWIVILLKAYNEVCKNTKNKRKVARGLERIFV